MYTTDRMIFHLIGAYDMTQNYSPFTELMSYFYFNFNVYYVLLSILALNVLRTITGFYSNCNGPKPISGYDFLISILVGIGLLDALYFQGVLSDISNIESDKWFGKMFAVCFAALILFSVQVVLSIIACKKVVRRK